MRLLALLILAASALVAQTATYPGAVVTDSQLRVAANQFTSPTLSLPILSSDTAATISNTAGIPINSVVTIDNEHLAVCNVVGNALWFGKASCPNVDGRGFDGTAATGHATGAAVNLNIDAWHHNAVKEEVKAIETALGPGMANVPQPTYPIAVNKGGTGTPSVTGVLIGGGTNPLAGVTGTPRQQLRVKPNQAGTIYEFADPAVFNAADYAFPAQTPGGSLAIGSNTVTIAPVPLGVNGTDTSHYLYITGGAGIAEPVLLTGGTAVAGGASGTVIVTCANTHTGAWTIASATSGISEAIWALPAGGGLIAVHGGTLAVHAPIKRRLLMPIWLRGQGKRVTALAVAADFPLSGVNAVIDWSPGDTFPAPVGGASDFTVQFIQPDSTNVGTYTHWKPAIYTQGTAHSDWRNIEISAAWDGVLIDTSLNGAQFYDIDMSPFHRGFSIDQSYDSVLIVRAHFWPFGLTANQTTALAASTTGNIAFWIGRVDDLKVLDTTTAIPAADVHIGSDGNASTGIFTNFWMDVAGYTQSNGIIRMSGGSSAAAGTARCITFTGGQLMIDNMQIANDGNSNTILASASNVFPNAPGAAYPPFFMLSNSYIGSFNHDVVPPLQCATAAPYTGIFECVLTGNIFVRTAGIAYAQSTVSIVAGTGDTRVTASGNRIWDNAGGSGYFIATSADTYHSVSDSNVIGAGWSWSFPAAQAKAKLPSAPSFVNTLVASANTITPTGPLFHVSGTTVLKTMNFPAGFPQRQVCILWDAAGSTDATGNFAVATTGAAGKATCFLYGNDAKWHPNN